MTPRLIQRYGVFLRSAAACAKALVYNLCRAFLPVRANRVFIESHKGDLLYGSLYYVVEHILQARKYDRLEIVVVARFDLGCMAADGRWARVRFCRPGGLSYLLNLATSRYLFNDVSFPEWFSRRAGQIYLNVWHGTPVKALGVAVGSGVNMNLRNMQRNFMHATHILFPNAHTENVLKNSFCLKPFWNGVPIRLGYPRNDVLCAPGMFRHSQNGKFHVAYMPTWRGGHLSLSEGAAECADIVREFIFQFVASAPDDVVLWVKLHPLMAGALELGDSGRVRAFPFGVEPYSHLAGCDALVTDYSSVMIDFSVSRKPVYLFVPDHQVYSKKQGFAISLDELPFPVYSDSSALIVDLVSDLKGGVGGRSNGLLESLICNDDGASAEALCEFFFDQDGSGVAASPTLARDSKALVLVEDPREIVCLSDFRTLISLLRNSGFSVLVATPGWREDCADFISLVVSEGAGYFPSVSLASGRACGFLGRFEMLRLFGGLSFDVVYVIGECNFYRSLISSIPKERLRRVLSNNCVAIVDNVRVGDIA